MKDKEKEKIRKLSDETLDAVSGGMDGKVRLPDSDTSVSSPCYSAMFSGGIHPPEADNPCAIGSSCYQGMFTGSIPQVIVPDPGVPDNGGCSGMFSESLQEND